MNRLSHLTSLLMLASVGSAQVPNIIPFSVTGSLDNCNADVNSFNIKVPKNLIVQFPVVWALFSELCSAEAGGYETTVVGNIVNGEVIAGQVSVAQRLGLEGSHGYISTINSDGTPQIASGPRVRINDPDGLFGPKTDAKSPPGPLSMVLSKVGDFIEHSGLRVGSEEILASSIVCINLHITTQAGNNVPNYTRVEDFLMGVPDTAGNVEVADIRVIRFLSGCACSTVTISAIEVDPCTGKETYRSISTATPRQETRCKWEARIASPAQAPFTREYRITTNTPVKETNDGIKAGQYIQAVSEWIFPEVDVPGTNPPAFKFTDIRGLVRGDFLDGKQYGPLSPFPGSSPPVPSKACKPEDITDPNATPTPSCTPNTDSPQTAPVASIAAIASAQRAGIEVFLSGSNIAQGLNDNDLNFNWTKTSPSSSSVSVTNANSPKATFIAPILNIETSFVFQLTVSLKSTATNFSKANVTVKVNPTVADSVTLDTYIWGSRQSGSIAVTCSSNVKNGNIKGMTLVLNGNTRLAMSKNGEEGKWTYSARNTGRPNNLKCVSDLKGESPSRLGTATTRRR
ncbi:uncharacterized protein K460DRAFT_383634 [Cucurbitaria berberidis CBS 394.84]|uniref:Uncharacterized protein n=1 Tax=Cucurbitaria berberidis CBS 394.84 TaxID=1168544 RepID=A0A9P4GKR3_9PLEO|nr:uncharacterized protein K460DRAFT_383634 [Cucurbitaria berberidis CBS 394.84]KAF1847141.1 hypothetical protein K460DRAFT_383634 [Cucurbitaria berberidis CBS 394.84]